MARMTVRGMTLMEVLAAVFCLGMGLVMVAGAFPAGAQQTQMTVEQTESAMMARSAIDGFLAQGNTLRNLKNYQWNGKSNVPFTEGLPVDAWGVWNSYRLPYMENWNESKMLPPGGGDYVMRTFVTRVGENAEAPLFRMTVVVGKFQNQAPDYYDHAIMSSSGVNPTANTSDWPGDHLMSPGIRWLKVTTYDESDPTVGPTLTTAKPGQANYPDPPTNNFVVNDHYVKPGDYVMDTSTGWCYRIKAVDGAKLILFEAPKLLPNNVGLQRRWFVFRDVIGVYYRLISQ